MRQNPSSRMVKMAEAQALAERHGFMFIETSALAAENVSLAFEELLNSISDIKQ